MFPFKKHKDLEFFLDSTQIYFDIIAITETILTNKFPVNDVNLPNYSYNIAQLSHLQEVLCYA